MERIDDAVSRILKIKYSMGLFQKPLKVTTNKMMLDHLKID